MCYYHLEVNQGKIKAIMDFLNAEVERHKDQEGMEKMSWGRGFENGSMTEAIITRNFIRGLMCEHK